LEFAARYLGADEHGRETFSYLEGEVPDDLDAGFSNATMSAAARLIRRFITRPLERHLRKAPRPNWRPGPQLYAIPRK
jgi:hypothetical protein